MPKLKAGVIGLGVGERHALGYQRHPNTELAIICDIDPKKLKEVAARYPDARATTNPNEVLADPSINIVSIASYDSAHYEQVIAALANNKHIFVEKPLCATRAQAENIQNFLKKKPDLILSCRFPCRLIPRFVAVKKLVEERVFGQIYSVATAYNYGRREKLTAGWRAQEPNYSVVLGGGVHIVDLLLWLIQQPITSVRAQANHIALANTSFHSLDFIKSTVRFANDIIGDVTCNFGGVFPHFHSLQIDGDKATYINRLEFGEFVTSPDVGVPPQHIIADYPGDKGKLEHQFSFIDTITEKRPQPLVTAEEIFAALDVCFAIEESI